MGILDRIRNSWYNRPIKTRRRAPEEIGMGKCKVTIKYMDGKVSRGGRYGASQHVDTVVRFCEESELDDVVKQFRDRGEIIEVRINR
jgi:hypothetical protein